MCGGFTCSKNALIALNVLYVVRYMVTHKDIIPHYWLLKYDLIFHITGGGFYLDISGGVWAGIVAVRKSAHRRRYFGMWSVPDTDILVRVSRGCETSSGDAVLCILFLNVRTH